jgi:hypothetical protein
MAIAVGFLFSPHAAVLDVAAAVAIDVKILFSPRSKNILKMLLHSGLNVDVVVVASARLESYIFHGGPCFEMLHKSFLVLILLTDVRISFLPRESGLDVDVAVKVGIIFSPRAAETPFVRAAETPWLKHLSSLSSLLSRSGLSSPRVGQDYGHRRRCCQRRLQGLLARVMLSSIS